MTATDIEKSLLETYPNGELAVVDQTGQGNHFEVRINNNVFTEGLSRVEKHQQIMKIFDAELKSGSIHALAIKIF